ncbi:peptidoglycan DD-metalloendopeptidase family protein [Priestia aryabhattai]|uniref:peptidoglycan DD-metalloendopeptidase family protein n=1 Tax=Priestia aryabhattai TaxID=412384 RepID=UPI001C8F0BDA|nr:peptidoglycan DD-metalloendopeptidase family protein [Priestia aryabhattai]MBY0077950.1 peptidoglycan DD-metalloendopeptidase family protein [Priestia aryabhattai]
MGTFTLTFTLLRNWKFILTVFLLGFGAVFMVVAAAVTQQFQQQQQEQSYGGTANQGATITALGDKFIPKEYIPIYQMAGKKYNIPWELIMAIHRVETHFGADLNTSSVGAIGHTQFMKASWIGWSYPGRTRLGDLNISNDVLMNPAMIARYGGFGQDCSGDGKADPYNVADAMCSTANYLAKNGGSSGNYRRAVYQYNHAGWYVDRVFKFMNLYTSKGATAVSVNATQTTGGQSGPVIHGAAGVASYYLNTFRISTPFAPNGINDGVHGARGHRGIDLARKSGASILGMDVKSLSEGVVEQVLIWNPEAGNGIRIKSGNYQFSYIHMKAPTNLKVGDRVTVGQTLGGIGSTGFSTGPHLDLKVKLNGQYIDPAKLLHDMMNAK